MGGINGLELPVPAIPKCSQWDLDQVNTQCGPLSGGRRELQRSPVERPSHYRTDEGPQSRRNARCNIST